MKGIRKTSSANVFLNKNKNQFLINNVEIDKYFNNQEKFINKVLEPIRLLDIECGFKAKVQGGGTTGQSEALRYSLTKTIIETMPEHKEKLKKQYYSKCDTRFVERKKTGQPKARKSPTFVKR